MGLGTGKFKAPVFYSTGSTAQSYEVKLADLNGDGKLDIVTANGDGTLSVLLNKGNGTFGPATLITSAASLNPYQDDLVIGDFSGDGKADIALATYSRQKAALCAARERRWHIRNSDRDRPLPIMRISLAAGDFNNDGKLDLVVATDSCPYNVRPYLRRCGLRRAARRAEAANLSPRSENCVGGQLLATSGGGRLQRRRQTRICSSRRPPTPREPTRSVLR